MAWLNINKAPLKKTEKREVPEGLWIRCDSCQEIIYRDDFEKYQSVCPKCEHHYPLSARRRIEIFCDSDSFVETDQNLESSDPIEFVDQKTYVQRLQAAQVKTGLKDAIVIGSGQLKGIPILVGAIDFFFMGGSMGSVVGEKIARLFVKGAEQRKPVVIFSSSGGARMHEGLVSLMQLAKTCTALSMMKDAGVPMISVLCHPTTGGVSASYAMLGDINIGEPKALIGFAGPRVIAQSMRQTLPEGFQTAEYLLEHGMLDMVIHRKDLPCEISRILNILF